MDVNHYTVDSSRCSTINLGQYRFKICRMLLRFVVFFTITIIFLSSIMLTTAWIDYDLVKVEILNNTKEPMDYQITRKRIDRYTFVIDGPIAFTDLGGYEAELKIYHSAPDSTKFVLSPFKLPKAYIEKALSREYRNYLMKPLKDYSDFPYSDDESEDLYPKFLNHKFTIKEFLLHNTTIPSDMADGTYKCYLLIYKGMDVINGIYVMLKLY